MVLLPTDIAMPHEPLKWCFLEKCVCSSHTLQCSPQHDCVFVELRWLCIVGMAELTGPLTCVLWELFPSSPRLTKGVLFLNYDVGMKYKF